LNPYALWALEPKSSASANFATPASPLDFTLHYALVRHRRSHKLCGRLTSYGLGLLVRAHGEEPLSIIYSEQIALANPTRKRQRKTLALGGLLWLIVIVPLCTSLQQKAILEGRWIGDSNARDILQINAELNPMCDSYRLVFDTAKKVSTPSGVVHNGRHAIEEFAGDRGSYQSRLDTRGADLQYFRTIWGWDWHGAFRHVIPVFGIQRHSRIGSRNMAPVYGLDFKSYRFSNSANLLHLLLVMPSSREENDPVNQTCKTLQHAQS
jgi:hypothetical protein